MENAVLMEKQKVEFLAMAPLAANSAKGERREVESDASKICHISKERFDALVKSVVSEPGRLADFLARYPEVKVGENFLQGLGEVRKAAFVMELVEVHGALDLRYELVKGRLPRTATAVLDEKKGNCIELSLLYVALAEQLGLKNLGVMNIRWKGDDGKEVVHAAVVVKAGGTTIIADPSHRVILPINGDIALTDIPKHRNIIEQYQKAVNQTCKFFGMPGIDKMEEVDVLASPSQFPAMYWNNGAVFYADNKRYEEAVSWAEKAYHSDRSFTPIRLNLLSVYRAAEIFYNAKEDYRDAALMYERYVKIERNPEVYYQLGVDYAMSGERKKAMDAFENVIKMEPVYSMLHWRAEFNIAKLELLGLAK